MQVILKPVTHPELGEIIVKDDLFAIGRHEKPFSDYEARFIEKLSRRHARIFEQDGAVYIADLGSLNGTTVNGMSVDTSPLKLQRGDEICFTGYLRYQIEILGSVASRVAEPAAVSPVQLLLKPEKQQDTLEPIVITQFPFLVNKASEVFAKYKDLLPQEVSYISRRHAHIFLRDRDVFIEDLGSTNGTFVNGQRLEEHARKLQEGDRVAFGGDNFVYRAGMHYANDEATSKPQENSELFTETEHDIEDPTRTTFVTSANSFLDIFCVEDEKQAAGQNDADAANVSARPDSAVAGKGTGGGSDPLAMSRPRVMLRELRSAFFDTKDSGPSKIWLLVVLLICIGVASIYFGTAPKREVRELLEQGQYAQAAVDANKYLASHPDDQEIRDLATEAILKEKVPDWLAAVDKPSFDQAEQVLQQGRTVSSENLQAQRIFDALSWLTRLDQFISQRGGPEQPLRLYQEEETVNTLVDWWERDPKTHRRNLSMVSQHVPEFAEYREQTLSHLRVLQNHQSLSIAAIERLTDKIRNNLQRGDSLQLQDLLDNFERKYPRIEGVQKLHADLEKYQLINTELQANNWIKAQGLAAATSFETPVFQERVQWLSEKELPSPDIVERYATAQQQWRDGQTEASLKALDMLSRERWGEVAKARLERNRALLRDFESLKQAQGQPGYDNRLLSFYRVLDPVQDIYFINAVEDEFQVHRQKAVSQARQLKSAALVAWERYRETGGIRGRHRLEAGVSDTFKQRAGLLSEAYSSMHRALAIYRLLKVSYSTDLDEQFAQIENEVRLQRQSLTELEMVLEPSLRNAKIGLLPVLGGETDVLDVTRTESKE